MLGSFLGWLKFRVKSIVASFESINKSRTGFEILRKETYLKMIENAVGARMFCSIFVRKNDTGGTEDICQNGERSCAFFVSSLLTTCGLMNERIRTTVKGLRENLTYASGWERVAGDVLPGDVLFWESMIFDDGSECEHVGFALNRHEAVSTSSKERMVVKHGITSGYKSSFPPRKIVQAFRCKFKDMEPKREDLKMITAMKEGLPANVNPFCIVADNDMFDGMFEQIAPEYFVTLKEPSRTDCPTKYRIRSELSQAEAEELVSNLVGVDVTRSLAVKREFSHIIPKNLRSEVFVAKRWDTLTGRCALIDCFQIK